MNILLSTVIGDLITLNAPLLLVVVCTGTDKLQPTRNTLKNRTVEIKSNQISAHVNFIRLISHNRSWYKVFLCWSQIINFTCTSINWLWRWRGGLCYLIYLQLKWNDIRYHLITIQDLLRRKYSPCGNLIFQPIGKMLTSVESLIDSLSIEAVFKKIVRVTPVSKRRERVRVNVSWTNFESSSSNAWLQHFRMDFNSSPPSTVKSWYFYF